MQKNGFEIAKKLIVSLVILAMCGSLIAPFSQALAQTGAVQDPGPTPPYDANVATCLTEYQAALLAGPFGQGLSGGMAPGGPNIPGATVQQLLVRLEECQAVKGQKQADWWYRRGLYLKNQWGMRVMTSVYGGLIDAMSMISQRIAYEAASDLLTGNPGNEPRFWNSDVSTWLDNASMDASSKFIDRLDVVVGDWTQSTTAKYDPKTNQVIPGFRFSFCKPPDPYTLRLSLGLGEVARLGPGACNLKKVAENFQAIGDLISSGDAIQLHRPTVQYGASDLSVGTEVNSTYFNYMINKRAGLALNRQEDQGMRPVMDVVSGKIKIPTVLMEQSYKDLSPTAMSKSSEAEQRGAILSAYFQVGLENIPILALTTFTNTLIVGLLHKWLDPKGGVNLVDNTATPAEITVRFDALKNADATGDAQDLYERQEFAKALGDYLIPNFSSTEDRDIISELTTCNTPRKRFNCAMDQALGVAIQVGTREGALTVGRASGIGSQGSTFSPATQALHDDWELIPENDLKNNTDPTCAQRAYCAGNLKKMRLARIIPIGWEMAANSPYNTKHNGRYITLGEVIRGFYDCSDQGKLDKDHPWCHLVDPNWILTAPKYQCRAKGFSDAILPGVGTRLEDCGDMVSCLKSNQNNECVGGFGYCLAERPVWKFDAKECDPQYVSCRTYNYVGGQVSLLRNTTDKGNCSEENMGCTWYATERYVTSTASPDNLWVSSVTSGPRVYFDRGAKPCSSEGCTKTFKVENGKSALNLVQNGSFEQVQTQVQAGQNITTGVTGWQSVQNVPIDYATIISNTEYSIGSNSVALKATALQQYVPISPGRNYVLSFNAKTSNDAGNIYTNFIQLSFYNTSALTGQTKRVVKKVSVYGDCLFVNPDLLDYLREIESIDAPTAEWKQFNCQFVSPPGANLVRFYIKGQAPKTYYMDGIQLEEGEAMTPFVDGLNSNLKEAYLKIAPDEYQCTGDDTKDHPGCKRFARVCRQTDVGCQGYKDVEDVTAPEIPANLTAKDLCPAICAGYGEYRKLPSTFDLVKDPSHPLFNDPQDETTSYFIPGSLTEACTLEDVGCEPFTSMEAATSTGEKVAYYKDVRLCQKPNDKTATYFTWEGSDVSGYQIKTWSLIASTTDMAYVTSSPPKLVLRGSALGQIKDPATCNDISWKLGNDPDCRQFYDVGGHVYYNFYSQTISSDPACTTYRKDDSNEADCVQTGGDPVTASKSCTYQALPSESLSCPAVAGGCRAYLGPTGRNAINVFRDTFATGTQIAFDKIQGGNTKLQYSNESVLVGDRSLKLEAPLGSSIDATLKLAINSTSSLMRVSFWAKANRPRGQNDQPSKVMIDGVEAGTFYPDAIWSRFEVGPFTAKQNPTLIELIIPSQSQTQNNIVYVDTFSVDQLNDVQFVRKNHWAIPLACDSTPEGTPEPRYMVGCREYSSRNGDTVFVRNFSRLCRDTAIGCSAFIDTNDKPQPYPETKTIKGTAFPADFYSNNYAKHGAAKAYEEQFFGDWSATSQAYRYYYAIDDNRGRCDSSQSSCRGYGKPILRQDRIGLATTTYQVDPANAAIYANQKDLFGFDTVLFKDDWSKYLKDNGDPNMACRKDELFCDQFKSGNVTEYFRDPGKQACVWTKVKKLQKNDKNNIPSDGEYSGWFREGTDIPCYPSYLSSGNNYLMQFTGETDFAGWGGKCPVDQSECTEFVDPNDTSDPTHPEGRSYDIINGPKVDKTSCSGTADPLSGCVLFRDKGVGTLEANSQATYAKVMAEKGAAQPPIDCKGDPGNQYCKQVKAGICESLVSTINGKQCSSDAVCQPGTCQFNDSNVVIKVKMDRECARWMGCRTGETVYDSGQQKFVTQCSQLELCQKNSSTNDDLYCSVFTDRNKEDLLKAGQFITPEAYSSRLVGFGKLDYSGYTVPNHYLLPDTEPRAVGYDLLKGVNDQMADKYQYDKRLVAKLPVALTKMIGVDRCQDLATGRIGYFLQGTAKAPGLYCYLPVAEAQSLIQTGPGQQVSVDLNADQIADELKRGVNFQNAHYQSAIPAPECQLFPEESSPLPGYFVEKWNNHTNPPIPEKMIAGYENVKTCVYGEDCSCSYRKVRYSGGTELYYGMNGASPMIGVCRGGTRDGQPCVNRAFTPTEGGQVMISQDTMGAFEACGNGGFCEDIQDVVYVSGKYAYCFERDLTRTIDAPQGLAPCLTWAPMAPTGRYNATQSIATAGYLPVQGRGEYYCVAGTQGQTVETLSSLTDQRDPQTGVYQGVSFQAPGFNDHFECSYQYVMNQKSKDYTATYLNGGNNNSGSTELTSVPQVQMGDACRRTMICQGEEGDSRCTEEEGLWIQAGPNIGTTYSEYFIPYVPSLQTNKNENYYDYYYGLFHFSMVKAPDGSSCKWNPAWEGQTHVPIAGKDFSCSSYLQQVSDKSNQVYDAFKQDFPGILDRRSEAIVRDSSQTPLKLHCTLSSPGEANTGCYYKYWEADYKVQSKDKLFSYVQDTYTNQIVKQDPAKDTNFFNPKTVNNAACDSDHPYFGIRAMFQNVNVQENAMSSDMVESRSLNGPWQFVGFWISACMPYQVLSGTGGHTTADNALMYLKLQVSRVDVCKVVAQTIEPNTHDSRVFADRVWSSGAFIVPYIGAKYARFNEPFGSAIAAAQISSDPMVMGDSIPASSDPRRTPTFPDAGRGLAADFVGTDMDPWFSLTNLFARIYNIYKWDVNQVYSDTPICVDWPGKEGTQIGSGPICSHLNDKGQLDAAGALENIKMCSGWDSAKPVTDQTDLSQLWACNALSGVNRGLSCGTKSGKDHNSDPLCHNAPVMHYHYDDNTVGSLNLDMPLYGSCNRDTDGAGNPVVVLQPWKLYGEGKTFKLVKQNISLNSKCNDYRQALASQTIGNVLTILKPVSQDKFLQDIVAAGFDKTSTLSNFGKSNLGYENKAYKAFNYEYVGPDDELARKLFYQEILLTPEKLQDAMYSLMHFALDMRDNAYKKAFEDCDSATVDGNYRYWPFIQETKNGKGVSIRVKNVAGLLIEYIKAAEVAQETVSTYASRNDINQNDVSNVPANTLDMVYIANVNGSSVVERAVAKSYAYSMIMSRLGTPDPVTGKKSLFTTAAILSTGGNLPPLIGIEPLLEAISKMDLPPSPYDGAILVPEYLNLGPYYYSDITKQGGPFDVTLYTCGSDSVEPGKRCRPDKIGDNGTGTSVDCPKVIKAYAKDTIDSQQELSQLFYDLPYTFTQNTQGGDVSQNENGVNKKTIKVPKQGFCFKGLMFQGGNVNMNSGSTETEELAFYNWLYSTNQQAAGSNYMQDSLSKIMPGTGFCMGFNLFSRCNTNADCQFNTNQWWGMNDEGIAQNGTYYSGLRDLKIFSSLNNEFVTQGARTVNLPTPYTPKDGNLNYDQIDSKYKMDKNAPPIIANDFLSSPTRDLLFSKQFLKEWVKWAGSYDVSGGSSGRDFYWTKLISGGCQNQWYCKYADNIISVYNVFTDPSSKYVLYGLATTNAPGFEMNGLSNDNATGPMQEVGGFLMAEALQWYLRLSWFQLPNQYANEFMDIVGQSYAYNSSLGNSNSDVYQRRVTMATFAVNPWERFIRSLGFGARAYVHTNDGTTDEGGYGIGGSTMFGNDDAVNGMWDTINFIQVFYTTGKFYYAPYQNLANFKALVPQPNFGQDPARIFVDPVNINASFLWKHLFFTNIFPLINQDFTCHPSNLKDLQPPAASMILNANKDDRPEAGWLWPGKALEFFGLCDNFGFDQKYSDAVVAWLNERIQILVTNTPNGLEEIAKENIQAWDAKSKSMQIDRFDKTGWGLSMPKDSAAFNLYPGIIPAGLGYDYNNNKEIVNNDGRYDVYLPAHCEPAVGTKDNFSLFSGEALNNDFPFDKGIDTWIGDENWKNPKDPYQIGPKIDPAGNLDAWTSLQARLFIMPWVNPYSTNSLVGKNTSTFDKDKGFNFTQQAQLAFYNASVNLPEGGGRGMVQISDYRGTINGNIPAGEMNQAYRCERSGAKVKFESECNKDLIGTAWDYTEYESMDPNLLLKATIGPNGPKVSNLCKTPLDIAECKMDDGTLLPPDYSQVCDGTAANTDPDTDCNSCTHSPGFRPLVTKPLAYQLGNNASTNHLGEGGDMVPKKYPSATDVSSGLDTFGYMTKGTNTYGKGDLIAAYQPIPPRIAAPDTSKSSDSANAQPVFYTDTFSVNNQLKGVVYLGADQGSATIRFYAWAAHDQAPLRKISIDWGDGAVTLIDDAKLKNHKPICNTNMECTGMTGLGCTGDADCPPGTGSCMLTGRCENTDRFCYKSNTSLGDCGGVNQCKTRVLFGNSSEDCQQGYFEFTHIYKNKSGLSQCGSLFRCQYEPDVFKGSCRTGENALDRLAPKGGCYDNVLKTLRFTPRVMIEDNWGWCTGNCQENNEATPDNFQSDPNRTKVRHPNKGCWDGEDVRYNSDPTAVESPFGNECSADNEKGRPWVVYQGSIELSPTGAYVP